ncbi:hypothetical protein [Longispora albida]|uniref:hypothetical protein n=1 Tax=Longispora albida TaxID=203523 RepID=UPI00036B7DF4|nr:hypothetical protein [Longispora albida]
MIGLSIKVTCSAVNGCRDELGHLKARLQRHEVQGQSHQPCTVHAGLYHRR